MNRKTLEKRLINFAIAIVELTRTASNDPAAKHLSNQLMRSGTSSALNYGEAQSGESKRDFIHKMQISLKELRETHVCLQIIRGANLMSCESQLERIIDENNQLISIFVKSIETTKSNMAHRS